MCTCTVLALALAWRFRAHAVGSHAVMSPAGSGADRGHDDMTLVFTEPLLPTPSIQVANLHCPGRIVSVLEGGYNLHGGLVSAFARSVAAHVRALADPHKQVGLCCRAWAAGGPGGACEGIRQGGSYPGSCKWHVTVAPMMLGARRGPARSAEHGEVLRTAYYSGCAEAVYNRLQVWDPLESKVERELEHKRKEEKAAKAAARAAAAAAAELRRHEVEAAAAAAAGEAGTSGVEQGGEQAGSAEAAGGRSKRRRTGTVDYAALNAQLEAEAAAKAGASGKDGGSGGPEPMAE